MAADLKMADWKWIEALPAEALQEPERDSGRASTGRKAQRIPSIRSLPPSSQQSQRSNEMPTWAKVLVTLVVLTIAGLIGYALYMLYLAIVEHPFPFLFTAAIIAFIIYEKMRGD